MTSPSDNQHRPQRIFIEICGWESFQYSGSHRKPDPPWPWFRLHNNFIESQIWFAMTKPQQADFIALLSLVSRFGNFIPMDVKWLRSHGISSKTLSSLEKLSLIRIFSVPADDRKIKQLRSVLSGGTPCRGKEKRTEENRGAENEEDAQERTPGINDSDFPTTNVPNGNLTSDIKQSRTSTQEHHDPRSWNDLKRMVKPHIQKYGADSYLIHRFHGPELAMSRKQIDVCVNQLVADCEVTLPVKPMTTT